MNPQSLESLCMLAEIVNQTRNWKTALNTLIAALRQALIFDNFAIFRADVHGQLTDVAYARAVGRGKSAEADVAWGESIANQVLTTGKMVLQSPEDANHPDRLKLPYLLGLPLMSPEGVLGVLVFVRFGGPVYTAQQIQLAILASALVASLFEREIWQERMLHCEAMQRQMALQDEFVTTISHELRTPLGFIKGYSTTLLRDDTQWDLATQREFLTIIDEEADHLTALIENILETARLQSDTFQMNFQPVNLEEIIRDVVLRAQNRQKDMRIHLDLQPVPLIRGDAVRLAQVFENFFSNAAKYAPGAPITVRLWSSENILIASVADQGPGISSEHITLIFERFYRIPGEKTRPGTGLGLFICKQIIQVHGGQTWAESEPGKGTTFFISLPV